MRIGAEASELAPTQHVGACGADAYTKSIHEKHDFQSCCATDLGHID